MGILSIIRHRQNVDDEFCSPNSNNPSLSSAPKPSLLGRLRKRFNPFKAKGKRAETPLTRAEAALYVPEPEQWDWQRGDSAMFIGDELAGGNGGDGGRSLAVKAHKGGLKGKNSRDTLDGARSIAHDTLDSGIESNRVTFHGSDDEASSRPVKVSELDLPQIIITRASDDEGEASSISRNVDLAVSGLGGLGGWSEDDSGVPVVWKDAAQTDEKGEQKENGKGKGKGKEREKKGASVRKWG